ncbi:cellulose synthase (UDP-forming) [Pseudorhodobacter antarcticus]|uniref:Cellulose synthase (UDP-forming) n=1 Tax=Pseudorhodobacter antarcticus TaxID=1077947 RepID=A0A1H8MEE2_9RHOB|nr:glycosyltransferase family 2 protein [Pseudorhodobacter antarcticus]SEO15725.1 cellulose synthase (UDP-forming) [Pseudorhodobacter antarcticus]
MPNMPVSPFLAPILTRRSTLRYRGLAVLWLVAAAFFWAWWLQPVHVLALDRYVLVSACLFWIFFLQAYFLVMFLRARQAVDRPFAPLQGRFAMVVTKAPGEPFDMVAQTLRAMLEQDVPHDTWLADEDPQPLTRAWCDANGVRISTRKGVEAYHQQTWPRRTRCKEGNLAYFYDHYGYDAYDIVVQLDADHVPQAGYLRQMLLPFADPRVGYVSAPSICSANAQQSWAARTRLHAEAMFHGILQAGYSNGWAPMCIGSHYAVRTKALAAVGGLGPDLAEDHSTSMILNAGGWRGVHAMNAIAIGQGPATITDLVTQEFQWSRSLVTILLRHTPRYFGRLQGRQKFQFVFSQLWYPIFAVFMAVMFAMPIAALVFDMRFADVTFPAFLGHMLPSVLVLISLAYALRADGFFRPKDAKVLGWEKAVFAAVQWPWVLLGCTMAVVDRMRGGFVDFRVTPKGDRAAALVPWQVVLPYLMLAVLSLLPVLLVQDVANSAGFYVFALINAALYCSVFAIIITCHARENRIGMLQWPGQFAAQGACVLGLVAMIVFGAFDHGKGAMVALAATKGDVQLTRAQSIVAGAGQGGPGAVHVVYNAKWFAELLSDYRFERHVK